MARPAQQTAPTKDGPRVNGEIRAPQVRLIDENGDMVGVVSTREAIEMAEEASLDLIEISPNAVPPVAKISDYGKYKYEAQKKAHDAPKPQKVIAVK
ncbi:MAG: translation initiation factor IF-3, partial [Reyranella sp.]|nr:translation initiation factor IF-3 [Reyranella sp.]